MGFGLKVGLSFIGLLVVLFLLELASIGLFGFFEVRRENVRREIFEETKSYVHGKIQDLAKYKYEWERAKLKSDDVTMGAIEGTIRSQFAEFDVDKLNSEELKRFLIKVRGF